MDEKQTNQGAAGGEKVFAQEEMVEALEGGSCLLAERPGPCLICIFGASGDLTRRKLMPALYDLFLFHDLPQGTAILGAGRTELSDLEFRKSMRSAVEQAGLDLSQWNEFAGRLYYQTLGYDDPKSYQFLKKRIKEIDSRHQTGKNRLFNLALPPSLYMTVAAMLAEAGLSQQNEQGTGWVRLVVEKPFGRDLDSSQKLHKALHLGFAENQIFRIDHYLAKDTVQNILMFRFANTLFEPIWNRNYIDYVNIISAESLGVEYRAGYYEETGVLRDMFQNHMMQLLALVAAEPPSLFEADRVRDEKVKLFRSLRPFPVDKLYDYLALGQYQAGSIDGRAAPAYREEPGVSPDSLTPTFCAMKVFVDNWRWQGVPFYLTSGKRLNQKLTSIEIKFKEVPHSLLRHQLGEHIPADRLILGLQPEETMALIIQAKKPGPRFCLRSVGMNFNFHADGDEPKHDAYEKVLLDAMVGDQTLFWRQDGVELCWRFLDPILHECETCRDREGRLHLYPAGSWGPRAAAELAPTPYGKM